MKVVILAGGRGTRLGSETERIPKPMVEIGGKPILWHIMKHYAHYGFKEFIVAGGYKNEVLRRWLFPIPPRKNFPSNWKVTLVNTGLDTATGGRIKRLQPLIGNETFMLTYGDGVSTVNLNKLLCLHNNNNRIVTLTAVHPPGRWGELELDSNLVVSFVEKPQMSEGWINGGYMVLDKTIFCCVNDNSSF